MLHLIHSIVQLVGKASERSDGSLLQGAQPPNGRQCFVMAAVLVVM